MRLIKIAILTLLCACFTLRAQEKPINIWEGTECKEKVRLNKYLSNAAGFVTAATSNYILNRIWTFQSSNEQVATEYGTFMLVSVIGLGINSLVLYLLNEKMRWNFYVSKIFAIGVTTIWNFLANMVFTFR